MARELTSMENREDASRWKPMSFHPARNSGTFSTIVMRPTESWGTTALITWARPVTPAMATWLDAKKMSKDSANTREPAATIA